MMIVKFPGSESLGGKLTFYFRVSSSTGGGVGCVTDYGVGCATDYGVGTGHISLLFSY